MMKGKLVVSGSLHWLVPWFWSRWSFKWWNLYPSLIYEHHYFVHCDAVCSKLYFRVKFSFVSVCSTGRRGLPTDRWRERFGQSGYLSSARQQWCCQPTSGRIKQGSWTQQW